MMTPLTTRRPPRYPVVGRNHDGIYSCCIGGSTSPLATVTVVPTPLERPPSPRTSTPFLLGDDAADIATADIDIDCGSSDIGGGPAG